MQFLNPPAGAAGAGGGAADEVGWTGCRGRSAKPWICASTVSVTVSMTVHFTFFVTSSVTVLCIVTVVGVGFTVRLVQAAVTNYLRTGYLTVYGVSDNDECFCGTDTAEQLGFFAQDSADDYETSLGGRQPFSTRWQGGAFADAEYRGGIW